MTAAGGFPRVTIVVPARNEVLWIGECIASIAAQDYPHHRMQVVIVVDGQSTDGTDVVAKAMLEECDFERHEVVHNHETGTPNNLNVGLAMSIGEYVCRVDARSRVPIDYVRRCVQTLIIQPDVSVVGGAQVAIAAEPDARAHGIARALNNRWGMGLSRYRRGARSGCADTVYLGAFRTAQLLAVGGWDDAFATNQDFELNRRLAGNGAVWFDADLEVEYIGRSDLRSLFRQYRRFGAWKVRYWRRTGDRPQPRQVALLVGVPVAGAMALAAIGATRGWRRAALLTGLLTGAGAVEVFGSRRPQGGPAVHAWSSAALCVVGCGWLSGAWGELGRPSARRDRAARPALTRPTRSDGSVRVTHLAPAHVPFDTRVFHKEAKSLVEAGYAVTVIAPHDGDTTVDGVDLVGLPSPRGRVDRFVQGPIRLYRAARQTNADGFHVHDIEAVPAGIALRGRGKVVVWDSHEDYPRLVVDRPWIPSRVRRPLARVVALAERGAARLVDAIVSAEDEGARRFPRAKTTVVRNAPLTQEFEAPGPSMRARDNVLVYIGDITRQRGAVEMVDTVGALDAALQPKLVLVGRVGEPGLLDALHERPGWARVEYRGVQDRIGVLRALGEAKVGLVVWHPTRKHMEGAVPVKLLEYMAAGVPVVAADFPAIRDLVGTARAGALVDPCDLDAIVAAVDTLLRTNPEMLDRMSAATRAYMGATHTWDAEAQKLLAVYAKLFSPTVPK